MRLWLVQATEAYESGWCSRFKRAQSVSRVVQADSREEAMYMCMEKATPGLKAAEWTVEPVQGPVRQ